MTWTINITGHDDLQGDEKVAFEEGVVEKARALVAELASTEGGKVLIATVSTNTTGQVSIK